MRGGERDDRENIGRKEARGMMRIINYHYLTLAPLLAVESSVGVTGREPDVEL